MSYVNLGPSASPGPGDMLPSHIQQVSNLLSCLPATVWLGFSHRNPTWKQKVSRLGASKAPPWPLLLEAAFHLFFSPALWVLLQGLFLLIDPHHRVQSQVKEVGGCGTACLLLKFKHRDTTDLQYILWTHTVDWLE